MRLVTLLVCACVLVLVSSAGAGTWYVKADGTGDVPTIQAAVDSAAPGDTVLLASGTYTGAGNYNIILPDKAFLVISQTGDPADCVIDCEGYLDNNRRAFDCRSGWSERIIRGVTVKNGVAPSYGSGGAIYCEGTLTLRDCVFDSNLAAYNGGAVSFFGQGEQAVKNCTFIANQAEGTYVGGGAVAIEGFIMWVTIDSCSFYGNHGEAGGAVCCLQHEAEAYIRNSVFINNSADLMGGGVYVGLMVAHIENCTFFANDAPYGGGVLTGSSDLGYTLGDVRHCIIAYNTGGVGYSQGHFIPTDHALQCTNIFGNEGGDYVDSLETKLGVDGNFSADPEFCDAEMEPYDLSLCQSSPCLPGNHPYGYDCGLVGALGEGCICDPTRIRPSTWGGIKALYR